MFHVKSVEIIALENIMAFMHAMVALVFSRDLSGETDSIFVNHKSQDYVLWTKLIEINVVLVASKDASMLA